MISTKQVYVYVPLMYLLVVCAVIEHNAGLTDTLKSLAGPIIIALIALAVIAAIYLLFFRKKASAATTVVTAASEKK
jgi:hypothetical protein